jgi:Tol biopolymer transport system component
VFIDAEGHVRRSRAFQRGNSGFSSLEWSPDGSKFAGVAYWGVYSWLYVTNVDGSGSKELVFGGGYIGRPLWSPDGSQIFFSRSVYSSQASTIYAVSAGGGELQKLVQSASEPDLSPDGRALAYVALDQEGRRVGLGVARADGSEPHLVVEGEISHPAWSPDGSTIAFARAVGTTSRIVLISPDGSNERTIAIGTKPAWAPDGSWIAFALPGPQIYESQVAVVRPSGTDTHVVETGLPGAVTTAFFWRPSAPFPQHRRRCVLSGAHVIKGTNRGDVLLGGTGPDRLYGRGGDDVLFGGSGHDRLYGGKGDDFIDAYDAMRDYLFGGPGSDRGSYDLYRDRRRSVEHYVQPG